MPAMSTLQASAEVRRAPAERLAVRSALQPLVAAATAIALLGAALLLLFTPVWVHAALTLSGGGAWLGSDQLARSLSDRTIAELLLGPGAFAFAGPDGRPFYSADEQAHMRDVRLVLYAFLVLVATAVAVVVAAVLRRGRDAATWRGIARGGASLAVALLVAGAFAAVAFGAAFELFHRLLFPGGNWAFPADGNLIRLYPLGFWQLSSAALGALGIGGGLVTWLVARRRAERLEAASTEAGR
jgi:hypothetical protein